MITLNSKRTLQSTVTIPVTNHSLSTDESSTTTSSSSSSSSSSGTHITNRMRLFHRMITFKNTATTNSKPLISHSYNLHTFDVAQEQYSIVVHFLDETERTFYVDVSFEKEKIF